MTRSDQLLIRPARPTDHAAIVEMVATVWDGNDYLPIVWDQWLADTSGPLLVGELAGRPVAVAKLSALSPGEDWFEGLRIAPEQRGKGLAREMLRRCVELSRERGARTLRYMTGEDNPAMHRLGDQLGFRLLYAPVWYNGPALVGTPASVALPADRIAALLQNIERSPLLARTKGLYSYDWCIFELTEARLREHLRRGEVRSLPGGSAWAIILPNGENGVWLAHVEGAGEELEHLCRAILTRQAPFEGVYARALLPPDAPHVPALLAAGFADGDHQMRVYELLP